MKSITLIKVIATFLLVLACCCQENNLRFMEGDKPLEQVNISEQGEQRLLSVQDSEGNTEFQGESLNSAEEPSKTEGTEGRVLIKYCTPIGNPCATGKQCCSNSVCNGSMCIPKLG